MAVLWPDVDRQHRFPAASYGHHVVAFSYTANGSEQLRSSFACAATEFNSSDPNAPGSNGHVTDQGGFLGSAGADVPEGTAFRLKQGDGIMLNIHYINAGETPVDGDSYLDIKLVDASPTQKLASLFTTVETDFNIGAHAESSASMDCVVKSDLQILLMANHMHEYGVSASTEVVRAGSDQAEMLRADDTWTAEMQFNPIFSRWTGTAPFLVHAGDTLRTTCHWSNTTTASVTFPREMCISAGFVLTTGDHPTAPGTCINGRWLAN